MRHLWPASRNDQPFLTIKGHLTTYFMRAQPPTVEQARQLTCYWQQTIPSDYLDRMGHMNIQYYFRVIDEGASRMFESFGMDETYIATHQNGAFALESHIHYLAEIHQGDQISVHIRVVGQSAKRIHFAGYVVNDTHNRLAAMYENVGTHADLVARCSSPFPSELAAKIKQKFDQDSQLVWQSSLTNVIRA